MIAQATQQVYGVRRNGSDYFIQVPGGTDGRHENIKPLLWEPSTAVTVRAILLEAQLRGLDSPIERQSEREWTATFTRPIGKDSAFKRAGRGYGHEEPYMAGNPRNGWG
jgi:hypothetical protein